jgi:hypothetical protein
LLQSGKDVSVVQPPGDAVAGHEIGPRASGARWFMNHQQDEWISSPVVKARLEKLLAASRAMDYAARLRGHGRGLSGALAEQYALNAGIGQLEVRGQVLPALAAADVIDYTLGDSGIAHIEEYVGLSSPVIAQAIRVLDLCHAKTRAELCWADCDHAARRYSLIRPPSTCGLWTAALRSTMRSAMSLGARC